MGDEALREKAEHERLARKARAKEEAERKARERTAREASERAEAERKAREEAERKRALLKPGRVFRDCPDCPEVVVVPAGSFMMGSPSHEAGRGDDENPRHLVTISKPFAVGKYEVTRREFAAFARATGRNMGGGCWYFNLDREGEDKWKRDEARSWHSPGFEQTDMDPVTCVNWHDAQAYANWLSEKTNKRYRLPSEAEWEYAARGGTRTSRYWGDGASAQCVHANGADETFQKRYSGWVIASCRDGYVHTAPAGSFSANGFGLHDVLGNVYEWVEDCWNERYAGAPSDGSAWTFGECARRVRRGGSWLSSPRHLRSADRLRYTARDRISYFGFRVTRTLVP